MGTKLALAYTKKLLCQYANLLIVTYYQPLAEEHFFNLGLQLLISSILLS